MTHKSPLLTTLTATTVLFLSCASNAAIFGVDGRRPVRTGSTHQIVASATAMMISPTMIQTNVRGLIDLDFPTMSDVYGVCATEPNAQQPSNQIACTGFLIAPDLLVTAGHCMINVGEIRNKRNAFCESFSWLFDFHQLADGSTQTKDIDPSRLVACKEVVYAGFTYDFTPEPKTYVYKRDIAVIRLERPMTGRATLKLASSKERVGEQILTLGHSSGTPLMVSTGARVLRRDESKEYFTTNLDVVGGNSGGPVLNSAKEVIGVVVRSFPDQDYVLDSKKACYVRNVCDENLKNCLEPDAFPAGTDVQRIVDDIMVGTGGGSPE